jgi:benzodiazapine receptor
MKSLAKSPSKKNGFDVRASDVAFLVAPIAVGFGTARLFGPEGGFDETCSRNRSKLQPPGWAFGVAWSILYLLVGVAAFLAWRRSGREWTPGLIALSVSFGLLISWWLVFANRCLPTASFASILVAALSVYSATYLLWADGDVASAGAVIPLCIWITFASYLSYASMGPSPRAANS